MKYLSDYMSDKQTAVFNQFGAFFAFSDKQYEEKAIKCVRYASLGSGMVAPAKTANQLMDALDSIHKSAIQQDIDENGIKAIIHRELGNHECQITCDYDEVIDLLKPYGITAAQVAAEWSEFWDLCVENDWF